VNVVLLVFADDVFSIREAAPDRARTSCGGGREAGDRDQVQEGCGVGDGEEVWVDVGGRILGEQGGQCGWSIGAVYAGMPPDFRVVLKRARKAQTGYVATYREAMPVRQLVLDVSRCMQEFTQRGGVRPFGISVLIAGVDEASQSPALFQVDPSGAFFAWKATAVGKNFANAKVFLEKRYSEDMEIEDAIHTALNTLKESFEGAMNEFNVEVGIVTLQDPVFRQLTPAQIKDYLAEVL
jgi:20S proteasome alpha/beta subunit